MIFKTIDDDSALSGQRIVSIFEARRIAQEKVNASLKEHAAQLEIDKAALTSLEQKVASGTTYEEAYAQSMKRASAAAKEHAVTTKGLAGTTDTFVAKQKSAQAAMKATATSSKVAAVGVKALKLAFNMFSGIVISFTISKIIEGFQYLAESAERAKEKLENIRTDLSENSSSYESNRKTLEGLRSEYDELTNKADKLGGVQNLANDEYERYKEITSEILGITPKLITGWDDEGTAISNKNGLLQQSIDLLDEEYEKSIRNNTTKSKNEDVANGVIAELNDFENRADTKTISGTKYDLLWKDLRNYVNKAVANGIEYTYKSTGVVGKDSGDIAYAINEFVYGDSLYKATELNTAQGWLGSFLERISSSEENLKKFTESLSDTENPIYQWFTDEQIDQLIEDSNAYFQELDRIEDDRETYYQKFKDQLNWNAQTATDNDGENAYKQLSDESKTALTDYIDSLDYASIKTSDDFVDMANNVKSFTKLLASDNTLSDYMSDIYTPQGDDESIEDYSKRVNDAIEEVQNYAKDKKIDIPLDFTNPSDNIERLQQSYENTISRFTKQIDARSAKQLRDAKNNNDSNKVAELEKKFGLSDQHILENYFKENNINTQEEIDYFNKVTENATSATEAIKIHKKALSDLVGTSADLDIFSLKDANDTLTTLGKISESIDTIQKAFSTLNSAIDEYNNSGSISIDTIQSIIALGDNWYDYLLDENGALKLDKESLQKLTASRLADMKAQIQQNMIDNVKNITDNASAKEYLASTNYQVADSIDAVTEAMVNQTLAEKQSLVQSGDLSQNNYDLIEKKLRDDIEKTNLLFNNISLEDISLGGGSGSGSDSSSSKSSNTKIDFIEYRLKELDELANKVQSSIDEAVNAGDKNALLGQMQTVDNAKIDTYNKAISYYQKEASNYLEKIPAELREGAKNGAIAITEFIGDNSSEIADYIQQYRDLDNSIAEATEQVSSLRQEVIKLEKEKFDNIVNAFDSIGNIISSNKSIIESQITYLETSGERIGKGYYSSLKEQSNLQLEQLYKERDVLNKQLSTAMSNGVKYGSDEWKDMYSSIQNVDQAIIDTKNDIEGYNNSLRELDWTVFDDTIESIDTISNKLSNLLDLLKTEKVSGDFSGYSKDAITSMSLNAQKMQTANYVIEKTNKEIANLKASYNKGELSVSEYTERLESLENTLWDNISTYNSAKEAIIEIAKARINEEVEAIEKVTEANNKRISKLKEELQAEKDLQNYKRSLLEKQNDVSKLQAQINARMGSTDAETIAEREKLEQELADKLKEIKEMQEDQAYDDMMDSLDKEQTAFEEAQQKKIDTLNDSLDDTETLYNNMLNVIFNNTSVTYNRLNELSRQYGFTLEQNITSPWSKGSISSNTFRDTVYRNLNGVSDKFTQLQAKADSISFSKLNSQLGSLNLSTLSTMVSLLSSQINVSGITTGIGNIKSAIENLSKAFDTSAGKADNAINKYEKLDKAKKSSKDYWVFKNLASYDTQGEASAHIGFYAGTKGDVSVIKYGNKYVIAKWLKGFTSSGEASSQIGMLNGSGVYQRYKRGGEITANQNLDVIARSMGEDHIATIAYKEGERILTPEQNKAFLKMVDFSDLIAKSNIIKPFLPSNLSPIATPSLQIGTLLNVEGSIDKNSLPDVQKMLDKSKAEIFNEFGQMLKNKNGCRPR